MDKIVQAIREKQDRKHLTDQEIADVIGVHLVTWRRIKHGRRYGRKFFDGCRTAFPDIFLSTNASISSITNSNTPQTSPQRGGLKGLLSYLFKGGK